MVRLSILSLLLLVPAAFAQIQDPQVIPPAFRPPISSLITPQAMTGPLIRQTGSYVIIAWNDLGMHCISPRFADMAILPPYNNLRAIVIRKAGEEPRIVTSGITVAYSLYNNYSVAGKTDFWTYAQKLFGKKLAPGIGLTGNGLYGYMKVVGNQFQADGIPALPRTDDMVWNPFQRARVSMWGASNSGISGRTLAVVPVSDEMHCDKCHTAGGVAAKGLSKSVEQNILTTHDRYEKTTLMASRPVLCASCHADNALGTPGKSGVRNLSYAMHWKHHWAVPQPACYDCHPGANTKCNRSAIPDMGPVGTDPRCDNCHGDLDKMAASLRAGRRPWIDLPTCSQCHGGAYSTGTTRYRDAIGHGGVPCIACHNSPHAWTPSLLADDNLQSRTYQGNVHAIGYKNCAVCHTDGRTGRMPPHHDD